MNNYDDKMKIKMELWVCTVNQLITMLSVIIGWLFCKRIQQNHLFSIFDL